MKGQRIIEAMWPGLGRGYPSNDEPHPMSPIKVYHKHLPIQIEQGVKGRIAVHLL